MNKILDMLISKVGRENIGSRTLLGQALKRQGVARSGDFERIKALPRRKWDEAEDLGELTALLAAALRLPGGSMELWPQQAAALRDIHDHKGAFLPIGVGRGKALISLLAPVVLEAKRPVLFVPAALREQTNQKVIPEMRTQWRLHPDLKVIGYSEISLAKNAEMLNELQPDLIILDECHSVKNLKAGRTKRFTRYMRACPETMVVAMSGTVANRSIRDYAHIIRWALKDLLCPVPIKWGELSDWADALDEGVDEYRRLGPGVLAELCDTGETPRHGYRRRLTETPGVVATGEEELGVSLIVSAVTDIPIPGGLWDTIENMRKYWVDPNGDIITEPVDLWRKARQLALGFWYEWDPPAPKAWMEARKNWKTYVRETLSHNRRGLDTELQVWNECERNPVPEWSAWVAIKDTFVPNPVPRWLDDFAIKRAADWLSKRGGIAWVEHTAFGDRLAAECGVPYYGAGKNASYQILNAQGPIIASITAHGQGKNLQHYSQNLIVSPPPTGKTWEQLLGRTHRAGQQADEVVFDVFLHMDELESSFRQARHDARYLEDTLGSRQKLNYASII